MDSFICGSCAVVFHDIAEFFEHKKICLPLSLDKANESVENEHQTSVQATVLDASGKSTTFIIINSSVDDEKSLNSRFKEVDAAVLANVNPLHNSSNISQQNVPLSSASGIYLSACIAVMISQISLPLGMLIPGYFESRDPNRKSRVPVSRVPTGTQKGPNRRTYGE